jgi:hypothetical protein
MRRKTRADRAKFAHQMRLIGIPVREREVRPRNRRAHDGLAPGARETREPFEEFRRHAGVRDEPPMQMPRRNAKFFRDVGDSSPATRQ